MHVTEQAGKAKNPHSWSVSEKGPIHSCQGGLRAEISLSANTLECDCLVQPRLLQKSILAEVNTILLPLPRSQTVRSLRLLSGSPIRCSKVTTAFNMLCNEGGRQQMFLFSLTGMLYAEHNAYYKKGLKLCFRIQSKVQV